jgi:hypothetical protein
MAVVGTGSSGAPLPPSGPQFGSRRAGSCGVARTIEQCGATAVRSSTSSSGGTEERVDLVVWQRNPRTDGLRGEGLLKELARRRSEGDCGGSNRQPLVQIHNEVSPSPPPPSARERENRNTSRVGAQRGGFGCLNSVGCWS